LNRQRVFEDRRNDKAEPANRKHKRHSEDENRNDAAEPWQTVKIGQRDQIERQDDRLDQQIGQHLSGNGRERPWRRTIGRILGWNGPGQGAEQSDAHEQDLLQD
jgi:hypothetical protein